MLYSYPDLVKANPQAAERAAHAGRLSANLMFIDLPDDFDFRGPAPAAVKKTVGALRPSMPAKRKGLGDLVAVAAKPIAKAIDAVTGSNLTNCESCEERRKKLNTLGRKLTG